MSSCCSTADGKSQSSQNWDDARSCSSTVDPEDKGHRVGNFHNYYNFNPPSNRIDVLEECGLINVIATRLLDSSARMDGGSEEGERKRPKIDETNDIKSECPVPSSAKRKFTYCDLGCNEGDLTYRFAGVIQKRCKELSKQKQNDYSFEIQSLGLDIDAELIGRANAKYGHGGDSKTNADVCASFEVCNLCDEDQHLSKCRSFLGATECNALNVKDDSMDHTPPRRFDLTTLFCTTMWIHVHGGDDGLRRFLRRICAQTDMLLCEPQPSKCYRQANMRLRKMDRPELESVTSQSLAMRGDIENEICRVITECGFRRVVEGGRSEGNGDEVEDGCKTDEGGGKKAAAEKRTVWKRQLQLFVRC